MAATAAPAEHVPRHGRRRCVTLEVGGATAVKKILPVRERATTGAAEAANPLPQKGTVHRQARRCGRPTCRCARGQPHPYHALFWRQDGRLVKKYLKRDEVEAVRAACRERARREREVREVGRRSREAWRALLALIREVERSD
jgi:hypothetical protein